MILKIKFSKNKFPDETLVVECGTALSWIDSGKKLTFGFTGGDYAGGVKAYDHPDVDSFELLTDQGALIHRWEREEKQEVPGPVNTEVPTPVRPPVGWWLTNDQLESECQRIFGMPTIGDEENERLRLIREEMERRKKSLP